MSIFYVLPPRPVLGDCLARVLQEFLPGVDWNLADRARLAELVGQLVDGRKDVYVVYREDLPAEEPLPRALVHGYGAEPGDEVVEVRAAGEPGTRAGVHTRRWAVVPALGMPASSLAGSR